MALRDRVVGWTLGSGVVLAVLAWRFVGPWPALVVVLLALVVAAVTYRIEAPRIDLDHPEGWSTGSDDRAASERVDQ